MLNQTRIYDEEGVALRGNGSKSSRDKCSILTMLSFNPVLPITNLTRHRGSTQDLKPVEKVPCDSKLDNANLNVHKIVLVRNSTHISCIVKLVSDFFTGKRNKSIDHDETVNPKSPLSEPCIS